MEITACPKCGSKRIFQGTMGDGVLTGVTTKDVCRECGYQGPPLIFDSETEYKQFLDELSTDEKPSEAGKEQSPEEESVELTNEEKQIEDLLKETEETCSPALKKRDYVKEFIVAIVLSVIFMILLILGRYFGLNNLVFSADDLFTSVLFLIGDFAGVLIFFFLLVVVLVTLYRSIIPSIKKKQIILSVVHFLYIL